MSRNGSGTYAPPAASFPAVANTLIESAKYNNVVNDIASEITKSISNDGQTPILANLPMSGFKHTGAAAASASGEYAEYAQMVAAIAAAIAPLATSAALSALSSAALQNVEVGQLTRNMSSASGSQAVSGLGFAPRLIRVTAIVNTAAVKSEGITDAVNSYCIYKMAIGPEFTAATGPIVLVTSGSDNQIGAITLDADGFTITWTKTGSPVGTAYVNWEAIG